MKKPYLFFVFLFAWLTVAAHGATPTLPHVFKNRAGSIPLSELDENFSAFQATTGSGLVGFKQSGTGAVDRTMADRALDDALSIRDFGATGAGSPTNDCPAIQKTFDRAAVTGKAVYLPRATSGTYYCGTTQLTLAVGVKVFGDGASNIEWSTSMSSAALVITAPNVILQDIALIKPASTGPPASGVIAIDVQSNSFTARNVRIESFGAGAYQGWYIGIKFAQWTHYLYSSTIVAHYNAVWGNRANAILIHGGAYSAGSGGVGQSILLSGGAGHAVLGADIEGPAAAGIYVSDGGDASSGQGTVAIHGNYFEAQTDNIYILGSAGPGKNVRGVSIAGNFFNGLTTGRSAITANRVSGLHTAGNLIINHVTYGVDIGAIADGIDLQTSNVFLSSVGGWAAQHIDAAASGMFADPTTTKISLQNGFFALSNNAGSSVIGTKADDAVVLSGGNAALKGAQLQLFGQSHATVPRRGRLGSSADGATISYPLQWEDDGAGNPKLGMFGTAPVVKPTITGSRNANAALASLLSSGATMGLWTNSSTEGHLVPVGSTPTMGACGASPGVAGTDNAMLVTVGSGAVATACAVSFASAWTTAPVCIAQNDTDRVAYSMATTTGGLTITATAAFTAGSKFHVHCVGY